jgi:hypothetical protein
MRIHHRIFLFSSNFEYSADKTNASQATLQMIGIDNSKQSNRAQCRLNPLEYIGQRGISLSGSYQQGYSTAYNTQSHIKVVCNGYILTHILN